MAEPPSVGGIMGRQCLSKSSKKKTKTGLIRLKGMRFVFKHLKGVFAKNERGHRLNAIKKRF